MPVSQLRPDISVFPTPGALARAAADHVVESARQCISRTGVFSFVLSGGSTPKALYELLASDGYRDRVDWMRMEVFFGDERTVPPDDPQSNYHMAREALLAKVPIAEKKIHRMRGEIDPQTAASEYGRLLKERFGDGGADLVLLGLGEDAHTMSLFPNTEALHEKHHRCVANFVPKLNAWRITMTAPFINRANEILVLVSGPSKAVAVERVIGRPPDSLHYSMQLIRPRSAKLTWL